MDETIQDNVENVPENVENEPVAPEPEPDNSAENAEIIPEPKRRGRPAGANDRAPRKKTIKIVVEPLAQPEEPREDPAQEPAQPSQPSQPSQPQPVQAPEPPSPRTLHRQAAELILHMNNQRNEARRANLRDMYTKNLAIF